MRFGKAVRKMRLFWGLSQRELAERVGISRVTISHIETHSTPKPETEARLRAELGLTPEREQMLNELGGAMRFCTRCGWPIRGAQLLCGYCFAGKPLVRVAYYLDGQLHSASDYLPEPIAKAAAQAWRNEHNNGTANIIEEAL